MVVLSNHSQSQLPTMRKRPGGRNEGDGSPRFSPPASTATGAILATFTGDNAEKSTGPAAGAAAVA